MSTEVIAIKKVSSVSLMLGFLTIAAMMFFVQPASAAEESDRLESISTQLGLVEKVVDLLSQVLGNGEVLGVATDVAVPSDIDAVKARLADAKKDLEGTVTGYRDLGTQITAKRAERSALITRLASTSVAADRTTLKAEIVIVGEALKVLSEARTAASNSIAALRITIADLTALVKTLSVPVTSVPSSKAKISVVATEVKANTEAPDGKNYILDATIEFQVTAIDRDIYIPKKAARGTDKTAGINFRMHNAGVPAGAVTDGKAEVAFITLNADEEGEYFIVREGETEEFDVNVWYEPSTPVAVGLTLLSLNWNTAPSAPNTFTKFEPLAKFMTEAVIVPPFDALGTYTGYLNGKMFIQTKNISESDALENCMTNATANPKSSVKCDWNGKKIYDSSPLSPALSIVSPSSNQILERGKTHRVTWKSAGLGDAVVNVTLENKYAQDHLALYVPAKQGYADIVIPSTGPAGTIKGAATLMVWVTMLPESDPRSKVEPSIAVVVAEQSSATTTGTYTGYLNGKMFIQTKNISESDALENCKTNATANPKSAVKCEWNKKVVYTSPAVPTGTSTGTYIGYMNGKKFIVTKNITETDALENCTLNAESNPVASVRCTWGTKEIFKTDITKKGIYALDADDNNIVEKDGVTKASALKQCKAYIKKNPMPAVECTWEGVVIHKVPGTDPATDEAIFKVSDEDPDATTLVVDATDESDWMTVFAFDIDTDDSDNDIQVNSLVVKLESPSKGAVNEIVHDARLVINGETYDDYERTDGTGSSASLTFDMDGDEVIEAGEQVTVELQLTFNRQSGEYDNGDTIRASVNGAESEFEGADDFMGTGSVTGETHTLFTEGLEVEVADMSETKDTNSDATTADDTGTFTFEFDVTAFETDVYIPKTAMRSNTSAAAGVVYRITNGSGTPVTTGTVTGAMSSTADTSGAYYVVEEGETETFTVTVTYDPTVSGFYALQLQHIHWNSRESTPYTTMPLVPVSDFETDPLAI